MNLQTLKDQDYLLIAEEFYMTIICDVWLINIDKTNTVTKTQIKKVANIEKKALEIKEKIKSKKELLQIRKQIMSNKKA